MFVFLGNMEGQEVGIPSPALRMRPTIPLPCPQCENLLGASFVVPSCTLFLSEPLGGLHWWFGN